MAIVAMLRSRLPARALVLALAFALTACSVEPRPIALGNEACSHCHMVISERQFAAQALTTKGKAFSFDAIECLAEWVRGEASLGTELHSLWVTDFSETQSWVRAEDAVYLRSANVRSPMAAGLSAHASLAAASRYQAELGGEILTWPAVLELVPAQAGSGHRHAAPETGFP